MTSVKKALVSDDGQLYLLKKPLYKQGLFWSTLILSVLSFLFFLTSFSLVEENEAIHQALYRYGMFYDEEVGDIFYYEEALTGSGLATVRERLNQDSLTVVDQLLTDPNKVTAEAFEGAMADIRPAVEAYLDDLASHIGSYALEEGLTADEAAQLEASLETYRDFLDETYTELRSLYAKKGQADFSEADNMFVQEAVLYFMDPEQAVFNAQELSGTQI